MCYNTFKEIGGNWMIYFLIISIIAVIVDQFVKWWTVSNFDVYQGTQGVPGIFNIFYVQNRGAAWGMLENQHLLFYAITIIAVGVLVYLLWKERHSSKWVQLAYALMLAGAVGNFIDRLRLGYVVDMIRLEFIDFPIFNIADSYLTVGVGLLFLMILVKGESK